MRYALFVCVSLIKSAISVILTRDNGEGRAVCMKWREIFGHLLYRPREEADSFVLTENTAQATTSARVRQTAKIL